jgi:hypothetical protein
LAGTRQSNLDLGKIKMEQTRLLDGHRLWVFGFWPRTKSGLKVGVQGPLSMTILHINGSTWPAG